MFIKIVQVIVHISRRMKGKKRFNIKTCWKLKFNLEMQVEVITLMKELVKPNAKNKLQVPQMNLLP